MGVSGKYTKVSPVPPYAPLDQPKPTNDENVPLQIPASVPKKAESVNTPVPEPKKKRASPVPTAIIKGGVTKKKASPEKKRTSPPLEKRLPSKKSTKSPPVIDILDDTPPGPTRFPVKPYSPPSSNSPPLVPYEVSSDEDDLEVVQKRLSSMKLSSTSTPKAMPKNTSTIAGFTKVLSKKPSHPVIDLTDDTPTTSTRQIRMPRPKILIVPDNDGIEILSEKIVSRKPEIEVVNDSAKRGR
uniref:WH2 domain-containing protein n=1 Tax=Panagrellus redivivus TaxID=6233 RepID=A0A7E4UR77_PANRE